MNIQNYYNYNIAMRGKSPNKFIRDLAQKAWDKLPEKTLKGENAEKYSKIGNKISKPMENRLIMGASAIVLQPTIDYCNKKVDDETRNISVCRTLAKIIAGTIVGCLVRGSSYKLVEKMTQTNGVKKFSKALLPKKHLAALTEESLNKYKNALSTLIALITMCYTNFALDAPLTTYLTNKFTSKTNKIANKNNEIQEGKNA